LNSRNFGKELFLAIKTTTRARHPSFVLPVGKPMLAVLRPVATVPGCLDPNDIQLLTKWRNQYVKSFLTEFVATDTQTSQWLSGPVHGNLGKLLFMVETPDGKCVGHVGLGFIDWEKAYGEADAIVSGGNSPPGLMKESLLALMRWSRDVLQLTTLAVRVRSDNSAVEFYRKVGFQEYKRVPLVASLVGGGVNWSEDIEAQNSTASLVYMQLQLVDGH
jgi:RimJ/RimL family protein N-acetyltransferase